MDESFCHLQLEFDRLAKDYDDFYPRIPLEAIMEVFKRAKMDRCIDVLDIGCGTGRMTKLIAESIGAEEIVGIDFSRNMLHIAKRRTKLMSKSYEFALAEASALPFCDECFDLILHNQTIQFYKNLGLAFSESFRILKKFGKVVSIVASRSKKEAKSPLGFVAFAKELLGLEDEKPSTGSTNKHDTECLTTSEILGNLGKTLQVETYSMDYFETLTIKRITKIMQVRPFLLERLSDEKYEEICRKYLEYLRTKGLKRFRVKTKLTVMCIRKE